jgi:hypothetical protein
VKKYLVCLADKLTPKMLHARKIVLPEDKIESVKSCCRECRETGVAFDIIPITRINMPRLAVVLGQVKSVRS